MTSPLRILSLFSGIGGIDLGLEIAGYPHPMMQVEIDPFCSDVLERHWAGTRFARDVKALRASEVGPVDLICGGFPCQDVSSAGKGVGLSGARSGLWYEFARVIGECMPAAAIVENVASGASRWLPQIRQGLESLGYMTRAFAISGADVGAPHRRKRVFVLARRNELSAHEWTLFDDLHRSSSPPGLTMWPAPRGSEPYPWEPPRSVPSRTDKLRGAKLKALGNAVVPACAAVAGLLLADWIASSTPGTHVESSPEKLPHHLLYFPVGSAWPTPTATDHKASGAAGYSTESGRHSGTTLTDAVVRLGGQWATPSAQDGVRGAAPKSGQGARQGSGSLVEQALYSSKGMVLNPAWVERLMGFPKGWVS